MLTVAAGVLMRDGKVYVARRSGNRGYVGCWEYPGGKVERGEDWAMALAREWKEETGLEVVIPYEPFFRGRFVLTGGREIELVAGDVLSGKDREPQVLGSHDLSAWLTPVEVMKIVDQSTPSTKSITEAILRRNFIRAHGDTLCQVCMKPYRKHPDDMQELGWQDQPFLRVLCDGTRVKL